MKNKLQMYKIMTLLLILTIGFISCKTAENNIGKLKIAQTYYKSLDASDASAMAGVIADSLIIRENEYDYQEVFTKEQYLEWLKWDSVFEPTYEIIQIEQDDEIIKVKVSKMDKRILFLHEEPIVSNEFIRFDKNKITRVEKSYVIFNETTFLKNRERLLSWISENHPELNDFLYDQTETGGIKYLKAIELYKNKK